MRLKDFFIISIAIAFCKCDLLLFSNEEANPIEQNEHIGKNFDRLYLFSNTNDCTEKLSTSEKKDLCDEYCSNLSKQSLFQNNVTENKPEQNFVTKKQEKISNENDFNFLNLTGALSYYRNFVHSLVTHLKKLEEPEDDILEYKIGVEMNKFELTKLEKFSNLDNLTDTADMILDITDILKEMLVTIEPNKQPTIKEKIVEFAQSEIIDRNLIQHVLTVFLIVSLVILFYIYIRRFGLYITWRKVLGTFLFALFVLSVINNHKYLSQKKQILNQQKLKEFVPEECLVQNEGPKKGSSFYSRLFSVVKLQLGYTASSRRCLEYHEALFITSTQNNYVETVVFTVSEGMRPVATLFGDFINQFFSALTKDLSFYQYMPLIGLVTTVFLPIAFVIICFICLVLFGYEFNFFHLISFKKNESKKIETIAYKKEELLPILNLVKQETNKLDIKTIMPNESFPSLVDENLNETLTRSLRNIFERINDREIELRSEIEILKAQNKKLQFAIENNVESDLEKSEIEEARCLSIEYSDSNDKTESKEVEKCDKNRSKEISIGLSKSVKKSTAKAQSSKSENYKISKQSFIHKQESQNAQKIDDVDDDDEEDIYVILDEN